MTNIANPYILPFAKSQYGTKIRTKLNKLVNQAQKEEVFVFLYEIDYHLYRALCDIDKELKRLNALSFSQFALLKKRQYKHVCFLFLAVSDWTRFLSEWKTVKRWLPEYALTAQALCIAATAPAENIFAGDPELNPLAVGWLTMQSLLALRTTGSLQSLVAVCPLSLTAAQLQNAKAGSGFWSYQDYDSLLPDMLTEEKEFRRFPYGVFVYEQDYLKDIFGDTAFLICCKYQPQENGMTTCIFEPEILLASMSSRQVEQWYFALFQKPGMGKTDFDYVAMWEAIRYYLSCYLMTAFLSFLEKTTGSKLVWSDGLDATFGAEKSAFQEAWTGIAKQSSTDFLNQILRLPPAKPTILGCAAQSNTETSRLPSIQNDIPGLRAQLQLLLLKKKRKGDDAFLSLEFLTAFVNERTKNVSMVLSILVADMIQQDIVHPALRMTNGLMYSGLRISDNAEVLF